MGFDGELFFCLPGLLRGFAPTAGPARSLWAKLQQVHENFDFISNNLRFYHEQRMMSWGFIDFNGIDGILISADSYQQNW